MVILIGKKLYMDIIIKESGVAKPLVYMDTATGTECTLDILQMMGAFTNGTITYNEETKQYVAPIDEYNWWKDYLAKKQEEEKALYALCEEFGQAAVSQEFMKYQHLLHTDEENEHKVIQKIFETIRETLSAK